MTTIPMLESRHRTESDVAIQYGFTDFLNHNTGLHNAIISSSPTSETNLRQHSKHRGMNSDRHTLANIRVSRIFTFGSALFKDGKNTPPNTRQKYGRNPVLVRQVTSKH
jgi:hypothetical protein